MFHLQHLFIYLFIYLFTVLSYSRYQPSLRAPWCYREKILRSRGHSGGKPARFAVNLSLVLVYAKLRWIRFSRIYKDFVKLISTLRFALKISVPANSQNSVYWDIFLQVHSDNEWNSISHLYWCGEILHYVFVPSSISSFLAAWPLLTAAYTLLPHPL